MGEGLFSKLELVELELLNEEQIDNAVDGCSYVVHIASPCPMKQPKDENEVIEPAFKGTLSIMRAANQYNVKRVVLCSSYAAIVYREPENYKEMYREEDWSDVSVCLPYMKSKNVAEKAAWDYLISLPES